MFKKSASAGMSPKIPMLVGLLLLIAGVVGGVYLIQNRQSPIGTQAEVGTAPGQVEVSNVTSNSFTVSWVTQNMAAGFLSYGTDEGNLNSVARDKRDLMSSEYQQHQTHYVQVTGLSPGTEYFFVINSGRMAYTTAEGSSYIVTTATGSDVIGELPTISGTIQNVDGGVEEGAIVLISGPNLSKQSTLSDENGNWTIVLAQAFNPTLNGAGGIDGEDEIWIRTNSVGGNSSALLLGKQINDIPTLTTGQTFDFRSLVASGENSDSKFNFIDDLAAQSAGGGQTINIWNPQENEALNTSRPQFIGTAPANITVSITVIQGQDETDGTAQSDQRGNWRWTAEEDFSLGSHVVRASYTNDSGITFQAERRFSILGSSLGGPAIESSPSGGLAQTSPSPSPTTVAMAPTATPTASPTSTPVPSVLTPTVTVVPTVTAVLTPSEVSLTPTLTLTPTPTVTDEVSEISLTPTPTPALELPLASTTLPTYVLGIVVMLMVGIAVLLLN